MTIISESVLEEAVLGWFGNLRYQVVHGSTIAPGEPGAERDDYREVLLLDRLRGALRRLNPGLPNTAIEEAVRLLRATGASALVAENRAKTRLLVDGVTVEVPVPGGGVRGHVVRLIDAVDVGANDWLVVNQFTRPGPLARAAPTCSSSSTASRSATSS